MRVSLIGGTGFVGTYIVDRLLKSDHTPRLLVRPESSRRPPEHPSVEVVRGDVSQADAIAECVSGSDAVVYLIGILREFPSKGITFEELQYRGAERVMDAAKAEGVKRFLLMSANGVKPDGTAYQRTKYLAEESLKGSDLQWTIFRPAVIYGDPRGRMEFCTQLRHEIVDSPLPAPLFYDGLLPTDAGTFELAPVAVEDVAEAFVQALERPESIGETYELCGPDSLSWKQILTTIASAVGKSKWMLPAPAMGIKAVASLLDAQPWFPITRDQVTMLLEGNVCEGRNDFARLGIEPKRFDLASLSYLSRE